MVYRLRILSHLALVASLAVLNFSTTPVFAETAVAVEKNPPGDIPDTQVFVAYNGSGFSMKVPEGWSRTDQPTGARFTDKYNIIVAMVGDAATAPTISSAAATEVASLKAGGRAVKIADVKQVKLDGGEAIRIDYSANSEPNAVTGKQIRLEAIRFLLFKAGKLVTLDMAAPFGADNVDQWNLMSNSVRIP